MTTTFTLIGV